MSRNGRRASALPRVEVTTAGASPDEAAAIAAAIELFFEEAGATPAVPGASSVESPWLRAGLLEGVGLAADRGPLRPWR